MASKDQGIGAGILVAAVAVIVVYIWWLFFSPNLVYDGLSLRQWAVAIPVFILVIAVLAVAAWIGYTMATTPPPKPLEEIPELNNEVKKEVS